MIADQEDILLVNDPHPALTVFIETIDTTFIDIVATTFMVESVFQRTVVYDSQELGRK